MREVKYLQIPLIPGTGIVEFVNTESRIGATKTPENVKRKKPQKVKRNGELFNGSGFCLG